MLRLLYQRSESKQLPVIHPFRLAPVALLLWCYYPCMMTQRSASLVCQISARKCAQVYTT